MKQNQDILGIIRNRMPELTRNQRRLAETALKEQKVFALSTVTELSEYTGISPATIVRFAKSLGFGGYNGLQREMRRTMRADLPGPDRFRRARKPEPSSASPLSPTIEQELENIAALQDYHDQQTFEAAVRTISDASRIMVLGSRSSTSLANHFWFALSKAGLPAERVLTIDTNAYERVQSLDETGCAIIIGFPRYLKVLGDIIDFAAETGKRTVVITDSPFSPFRGDTTLFAPVESSSFIAFHSAPLILISTLMSEIANDRPERTLNALDCFEGLAERQDLFKPARQEE